MMEMADVKAPGDTEQEYAMEKSQFLDIFPFENAKTTKNTENASKYTR